MQSTRNIFFIMFIVFLLSAGFALATEDADALNAKRVEALLSTLPGSVHTSAIEVKGDTLVVRGLTASLRVQEGESTVRTVLSIDEITCTGVNFAAVDTPGVQRLAASVRIKGYAAKADFIPPAHMTGTHAFSNKTLTRSVSINDLHGDVADLNKAVSDTGSLIRLLRPLLSFRVDSMNMEEWSAHLEREGIRLRADINAFSTRDFGLLHSGPTKMEGFTLELDGKKALQIDSAGHESLRFTELVAPFLALDVTKPGMEAEALAILISSLKDLSFSMEGLHITGVRTLLTELGDNSLRRMSGSLTAAFPEVKLDGKVEDLTLSPTLYAAFGPQGKALAEYYGKSVQFSGGVQAAASNRLDGGSVTLDEFKAVEPNLGTAALSLKLTYSPSLLALFASPKDLNVGVQEAELLLDDRGIGDLFFALMLKENNQEPDEKLLSIVRSEAALGIRKAAHDKGGKYAEAAEALAQLCAQSGKVTLRLRSDAPIPMDDIINFRPLEELEAQYSAPEQRDAETP